VVHVSVKPPADLRQLKLIHKTVESLITHGPEFEALLMSRPEVQRDEKWAWIWDPRSTGGVWYRWRLWQTLSGSRGANARVGKGAAKGFSEFVFDGGAAWTAPKQGLRYEYITRIEEFVSDSEYESSDDDESGEEDHRRGHQHNRGGPPPTGEPTNVAAGDSEEAVYLNPLKKAKLTHLLARLPTSNAKLRKGDVARVTAFAIEHAGQGADEVVDLLVSNVETPFAFTAANIDRTQSGPDDVTREEEHVDREREKDKEDTSPAILVAMYIISDILSSSSTSGVRHAWRYRQLFETALKERRIFEFLGRLERSQQWGRLRAEKWKRSIGGILALWEGWCVFPQAAQEHFMAVFNEPPPTAREIEEGKRAERAVEADAGGGAMTKSKWKAVDVNAVAKDEGDRDGGTASIGEADDDRAIDQHGEDLDGDPMLSDEDFDIDGVPMDDSEDEVKDNQEPEPMQLDDHPDGGDEQSMAAATSPRPQAEDMFADSDKE
jgi:U2-associated protein SR140